MPKIRPVSDLRNKFNEISEICHDFEEPVFITKQGKEDLVVMSHSLYEMIMNKLNLYKRLGEAELLDIQGDTGITHTEMIARLENRML